MEKRSLRKERVGVVSSNKMDKTIVVAVRDKSANNERELIDKVADYKEDSFDEMIKALCLEDECEKEKNKKF